MDGFAIVVDEGALHQVARLRVFVEVAQQRGQPAGLDQDMGVKTHHDVRFGLAEHQVPH